MKPHSDDHYDEDQTDRLLRRRARNELIRWSLLVVNIVAMCGTLYWWGRVHGHTGFTIALVRGLIVAQMAAALWGAVEAFVMDLRLVGAETKLVAFVYGVFSVLCCFTLAISTT